MKNYLLANFILHHFNVLNFKLLILFDPAYYTPGAFLVGYGNRLELRIGLQVLKSHSEFFKI